MTKTKLSAYEQERLENIKQNRELLLSLNLVGISDSTSSLLGETPKGQRRIVNKNKRTTPDNDSDADDGGNWGGGRRAARGRLLEPSRRSKRLRGETAEPVTEIEERVVETGDVSEFLVDGSAHFTTDIVSQAIKVEGHYRGWVEHGVMGRLGIQGNATEAWESEGGGKFSFKDPLGTGKKVSKKSVPTGQSVAKFVASKLLKKNPNAFFYRHTEPGVEQWTGDWTDEERDVFLEVAREHGCGDKWGLFSTHIPHRVGYQCSNYYRQYVIPQGWIIDDNYRIDSGGHAVYVGKHKRGGA
ncbi:hypothetical protein IWW38_003419 [Coemansia aciculifera]|uniref:Uncharacterized protein n=1 Tax=Coemansia aciculifera TaxID=417176 RepID=A0ACC1M1B2_9FUNG|nr:hypothetical protein IWW38_003419 [Coemansia aciculifera]